MTAAAFRPAVTRRTGPASVLLYALLPNLADLSRLLLTWLVTLLLLLVGAGAAGRLVAPEMQIGAGWGVVCCVLTLWGVATGFSLAIPAAALALFAIFILFRPQRRPASAAWAALGRIWLVSLPIWLVMASIRPAEPDTWLNLLPNLVYLLDHGQLPTASRAASYSFLPAAPYDTQFLGYLGGLLDPDYAGAALSLLNLMLLLAAGLLVARALGEGTKPPGWVATALGFLLVTLFNPGFVPRIDLAAYGETGLAVTALMAAWLFVEAQTAHVEDRRGPGLLIPLALILAAGVNVKQSGPGMIAALAVAALAASLAERPALFRKSLDFTVKAVLPAALLWLLWRGFVAFAGVDELKPLAFADWQWSNIPAILASMVATIAGKGVYFACVAAALLALPLLLGRQGWTRTTRLLAFHVALVVFLLLTYIGHFPGEWSTEAHSYFRYETHLSLVLMLALALALRDLGFGGWIAAGFGGARRRRLLAAAVLLLALGAPIAFATQLRFDLVPPQSLVWTLAGNLARYLQDGDKVALLLPGDNGSVATMLGGILQDMPPRRRSLDLLDLDTADQAALDRAAAAGYPLALVSCTGRGIADLPPGQAVLMRHQEGIWRLVAIWPYPADAAKRHWQHILSWRPLCREEP
jgi:hypothetical protein